MELVKHILLMIYNKNCTGNNCQCSPLRSLVPFMLLSAILILIRNHKHPTLYIVGKKIQYNFSINFFNNFFLQDIYSHFSFLQACYNKLVLKSPFLFISGQCKRRVQDPLNGCTNPQCNNQSHDRMTSSLELRISLSDHTSGLDNVMLVREVAERILQCNVSIIKIFIYLIPVDQHLKFYFIDIF